MWRGYLATSGICTPIAPASRLRCTAACARNRPMAPDLDALRAVYAEVDRLLEGWSCARATGPTRRPPRAELAALGRRLRDAACGVAPSTSLRGQPRGGALAEAAA